MEVLAVVAAKRVKMRVKRVQNWCKNKSTTMTNEEVAETMINNAIEFNLIDVLQDL